MATYTTTTTKTNLSNEDQKQRTFHRLIFYKDDMDGTPGQRTVVLLRPNKADDKGRPDEYHECITKNCNVKCVSIPALQFNFCSTDQLISALENLETNAGIIFTSQRAVEAIANAVSSSRIDTFLVKNILQSIELFAVGKSTAKAIEEFGSSIGTKLETEGKDSGSAENLAKYIIEQRLYNPSTKPLLFLCGQLARPEVVDLLKNSGITTKSLCVYETIPHVNFKDEFKDFLNLNGDPNLIAFFSPSGADFTLPTIAENARNFNDIKIVAIGQTTASWLEQRGYKVQGVAKKPTATSLSECIQIVLNEI